MTYTHPLPGIRTLIYASISLLLASAACAQTDDPRGIKVLYREARSALVIGNGAYTSSPLANPVNDAEAMASLLEKRNFKVTLLKNADLQRMEAAVEIFGQSLGAGGVGLFFYAGHGMQIEGRNYLIPVGAQIENERDVKYNALDVGKVLGKMEDAGNRLNVVFLDACRDNPFARSFRTQATGLAQLDAPSGTLIAYATAPGKLAADGVDSNNSIYTRYLIEQLGVPGEEIGTALRAVRTKVRATTGNRQTPWESTSLEGAFYLTPIDMLDENLALSRAQLESLKKLQSEQAQAAANLKKLETEKNAEMAKLDAEIAALRQQAQQPGQAGSSLDQLLALGERRETVAAELAALLAASATFAQTDDPRGIKIRGSELETVLGTDAAIPRYHALVIGINRYQHWQDLRNARTDAEEVAGLLANRYGFQAVTTLYDEQATRDGIAGSLRRLTEQLGESDALLVFYAGHGYFDKLLKRGYWVPHEARERAASGPATTDWFSNNELQDFVAALRARHVLIVSDSCFSGSLFRGAVPDLSDKANAWYRRAIQQPSRWGISSGDLELVPDNSVFARQFVNALQYPLKPVFSASDLAGRIKVEVAGATGTQPLFGRLQTERDSQFGEFIFLDLGTGRSQAVPVGRTATGGDSTSVEISTGSPKIGDTSHSTATLETATDLKSETPLMGSPTDFGSRVRDNTWSMSYTNLMNYYEELLDDPERLLSLFNSFEPHLVPEFCT